MANPFLVLGGVVLGIVTAGFGIAQVPGWIGAAQDGAAQNDIDQVKMAQASSITQTGRPPRLHLGAEHGSHRRHHPAVHRREGRHLDQQLRLRRRDAVGEREVLRVHQRRQDRLRHDHRTRSHRRRHPTDRADRAGHRQLTRTTRCGWPPPEKE